MSASPGRSSARSRPGWGAILLVALVAFAVGLWVGVRFFAAPQPPASVEPAAGVPPLTEPLPSTPSRHQPPVEVGPAVGGERPRIALMIDDLGRSVADLDVLEALGVPLSCAVLPYETRTADVVAEIRRRGWELLLHLPMEPQSGADPGPGALSSIMTPGEIEGATRKALAAVPGAVGVNNHMGSVLSADVGSMSAVLGVVGEKGLFYVDSRTSADSVGYRRALEMGVPATERQVFLDSDPVPTAIEEQFDRLLQVARQRGAALAIGHPHRATLEVLARRIPEALDLGYEFVPVSFLLDRAAVTPE